MKIDNNEKKDVNEIIQMKYEYAEKKKVNILSLIKWPISLYIIGALVLILEITIGYLKVNIYNFVSKSEFLNIELTTVSNVIRGPLIAIIITAPFFIPSIALFFLMKLIVDKIKIFTNLQRNVVLSIIAFLFILTSVTMYII